MNMIGHDHKGVHLIMLQTGAVFDRGDHQLSDSWLSEKGGAEAGLVEQPVHGDEGFARGEIRGWKRAIVGKTSVQAERDEQRLADDIDVRESAPF